MTTTRRVLVVEDDAETREGIAHALASDGHEVVRAGRGESGTRAVRSGAVDAVILDVMLPDGSGIDLCRDWRAAGVRLPILMLTARTDVQSRVRGLDAGADDYLGKPFALSELRARLRALLRRGASGDRSRTTRIGDVTLDLARRRAFTGSDEVPLTRREFDLLDRLVSARGRVVSRADLLDGLWGESTPESAASLEVIVARLRRKLDRRDGASLIRTVRGVGYALARGADETT